MDSEIIGWLWFYVLEWSGVEVGVVLEVELDMVWC